MPPEVHSEDIELARQAATGDNQAWREIYERTCQPLFNFLCYQAGDREAAKDLLQETYLTALQKLERYRGEGSLMNWLRTIALRKCLDWRRTLWQRLRKVNTVPEDLPSRSVQDSDARLETSSAVFQQALASLSPQQRAALLLRELEEMSFQEIAVALGCQEATARVHYHRGREKMQKSLAAADALVLSKNMGGQQA